MTPIPIQTGNYIANLNAGDLGSATVPTQDGEGRVDIVLKAVPEPPERGCDGCFGELRYLQNPDDPDSDTSYCDLLPVKCSHKHIILAPHCETSTVMAVLHKLEGDDT